MMRVIIAVALVLCSAFGIAQPVNKPLGPTFGQELVAAGFRGAPLSWSEDGTILGRERLTREQNTTLDGVIAAHNPAAKPPVIATVEERLATAEKRAAAIEAAAIAKGVLTKEEIDAAVRKP